jgi:hypothetical protein
MAKEQIGMKVFIIRPVDRVVAVQTRSPEPLSQIGPFALSAYIRMHLLL